MNYAAWIDELDKNSINVGGGKGANLGEMFRIGMPVPEGFIVTTKAFDEYIELNKIKEPIQKLIDSLDTENTAKLLETSKQIKNLILSRDYPIEMRNQIVKSYNQLSYSRDIKIPKALALISAGREYALVAVRSSATAEDLPTASFAGQQATFLNVKGIRDLLKSVKECWASLYEPRAIFYRAKQGFKHASIAVIVQRMISSEKSGVIFTVNPSTNEDIVLIEACFGLGESLVSGAVQPDSYIVTKDLKSIEKKIGKKEVMKVRDVASDKTVELKVPKQKVEAQVLTDDEVIRLARHAIKIEKHYKKPQDIEWCIENGRIYIVQTRAVTTKGKVEEIKIEAEPILKGLGVSPGLATGIVRLVHGSEDITKVKKGDILVTTMTSPDLVPTMSKCAAIITDSGGQTCHAAIVSREMQIPCIVGTHTGTKILKDGQMITVDAYNGLVYPGKIEIKKPVKVVITKKLPKTKTMIKVNMAFPEVPEDIPKVADGVGLLRIEHMIIKSGIHPGKLVRDGRKGEYIKILLDGIRPIAKTFHPKPVWVRTLDARSDEFRNLEGGKEEPKEDNPMLGWHGVRRSLDEPELLKTEFEAMKMLHEEGLDNVHIMLPFIISAEEFKKAKEIAEKAKLPEKCKLGIMVEVPSCALTIDKFCKEGIGFASIGSNDLTMMTLGVDRNNANISKLYSEMHPGVLKLIKDTIKTCNKYKIESSICGEAPSNIPKMVEFLVKCGIKSISVNIDAVQKAKEMVAKTEKKLK